MFIFSFVVCVNICNNFKKKSISCQGSSSVVSSPRTASSERFELTDFFFLHCNTYDKSYSAYSLEIKYKYNK